MNRSSHIRNPEVSVLMSCYNASRWLHEAIDSILAQTFENFEFILVDDGSTDDTWNIIQNYRDRDQRIIAISKKNSGLSSSLNVGIAQARGTWIARQDADDLSDPTRLEEQFRFVRAHPQVVLLGAGFVEIDANGHVIKKNFYPSGNRRLVWHLEHRMRFFPHSSAFYRLDAVRRANGYNPRMYNADDWRLWLELSLQGEIACLPKLLVRIRKHSAQISLDDSGKRQFYDATAATVGHLLRKSGCKDPSVDASANEWNVFQKWIEKRINESRALARRKSWVDARTAFFAAENRPAGALRFGIRLLQSGYASRLVWEKFFGSSLPKRLAREWMLAAK